MEKYESSQKQILKSQEAVYERLGNLKNYEKFMPSSDMMKEQMKVEDLEFGDDYISFKANMVGRVTLRIIDREAPKMLKFGMEGVPVAMNLWIQLVGVSEADTRMKLTIKADIPLMLKPMIGNKLGEGIERLADVIKIIAEAE